MKESKPQLPNHRPGQLAMFSRFTSSARLLSSRVSHSTFRVVTAGVGASAALFAAYKWSTDLSSAQCAVDRTCDWDL
jgi:hypothetical protein